MTRIDATPVSTVTTGAIRGSTKRYEDVAGFPGMAIPVRRVNLSNGEHFDLYDTSGPYTDDTAVIDVEAGLPKMRDDWQRPEPIDGAATQLVWARAGIVTAEMAYIAAREGMDAEFVRDEVARGRAVIPANHKHPESEPM